MSVPTGIANFHSNYINEGSLPREWAERIYNVTRFTDKPAGGHFAPAEEPDLLAAELTEFFGDADGQSTRAVHEQRGTEDQEARRIGRA